MAVLRVREMATARGYNQARLQLDSRVNPRTINQYWNNKIKSPSFAVLEKIAGALQCDVRDLIGEEDEAERPGA